jgi:DNA-binding MarR family transcriptional regulator
MDDYSPPKAISDLTTWKIGQLSNYARNVVSVALNADGLKRNHATVMTALDESGPSSQADLSRRLWIDPSDLHATLNDLEERGWIARKPDPSDRRRNLVELRKPGATALTRVQKRIDEAQATLLAPLDRKQRSEFNALLSTVLAHHEALHKR